MEDVVRRMSAESSRMRAMVEDLLTLASLDEEPELRREKVDIGRLLVDAAMDARAIQPSRSVSVAEPVQRVVVLGDAARLTQLVGILVSNALGHTPTESAIMLACSTTPLAATFSVRDAGPGMDAESAAHVFDRFWRGSTSRSRDRSAGRDVGAGLGLAIARSIVQAQGGTITLDSSPADGSCFTVKLPHV